MSKFCPRAGPLECDAVGQRTKRGSSEPQLGVYRERYEWAGEGQKYKLWGKARAIKTWAQASAQESSGSR